MEIIFIVFSFICAKRFDDLVGKDPIQRHCLTCNKKVINLDVLTDAEQQELSEIVSRAFMELCVSATVQRHFEADLCHQEPDNPMMLVGESISDFDYKNPITEEEAEIRLEEIFSAAQAATNEIIGTS